MRILDPLLFLIGHRGAIERIAATRHAWIVGAILVLSAGIARNYDHLDLLRQPEWFIGPFVASMVSIFFIFNCITVPLKLKATGKIGPQFLSFLTFAWMTAPCAWLYGIPVEATTDLITATKWNIAFLAIVSLWRVFLMTRAVAVLTDVTHPRAFVLILAPAAFEAMIGSLWKGMSLVQIMGGVRLPPHTQLLREASGFIVVTSFWVFLAAVVACWIVKGTAGRPLGRERTLSSVTSTTFAAFAAFAFAAWTIASVPFQPALQNKLKLENLIKKGRYAEAVAFASSKQRSDFTAYHEFPPGSRGRDALALLKATSPETPAWLRKEWNDIALESLKATPFFSEESLADLNKKHPEIADALRQYAKELRARWDSLDYDERWWLGHYERVTKTEPLKNPPPTR
ncbi:hypothetical protein OKA05_06660 [Luteolibacter arcticus]|uniref:DUF4153 domain-containing protein n=1 Tax=Luteolibacter arcticus TaxID=1581411 RepID=A0ABT3GF32_9BACT|nr:hypothetical protein [Luteolibacter arcticus]MCW1922227.1 hypothetical protein [Luteolibacter arcticus]